MRKAKSRFERIKLDRLRVKPSVKITGEFYVSTVEGDATAHYLADMAGRHSVQASRIAHGVPLGGELEYVDGGTLSHAFYGRRVVD